MRFTFFISAGLLRPRSSYPTIQKQKHTTPVFKHTTHKISEQEAEPLKVGIGEDEVLPDTLYYMILQDLIGLIRAAAPARMSDYELHSKVMKNIKNFPEQSQKLIDQWLKMQTVDGMTALHQFVKYPNIKFSNGKEIASDLVIKRFLELGRPEAVSEALAVENQDGLTPFEYAKKIGCEYADMLLDACSVLMHEDDINTLQHE